jgi:hypothetical protein
MQAFKNRRSAKLLAFDRDFALRRIKGEAPLWHRVLPLDDERFSVSAAGGMCAIHAEIVQNLLRYFGLVFRRNSTTGHHFSGRIPNGPPLLTTPCRSAIFRLCRAEQRCEKL